MLLAAIIQVFVDCLYPSIRSVLCPPAPPQRGPWVIPAASRNVTMRISYAMSMSLVMSSDDFGLECGDV